MTTFSAYDLVRNNEFDYSKARNELVYPRLYQETIRDEVAWLKTEGLIWSAIPDLMIKGSA